MRFIDQDARAEARYDAQREVEEEFERGMYFEAADYQAEKVCSKLRKRLGWTHNVPCLLEGDIVAALAGAIDYVPDLSILIKKAGVDRDSYIESQMTPAERYGF